ncbi:hypothetical protein [Endozoicomonas elysicola]|uniref:Uncharacterized protein n=1 Tax=Endozoicomonas elysicola TaxID=305900 RepID=A0A081KAG2_9GAMM|nr:hypothetical protein [Endozoicomonas elysicola]KEI71138.1 hypothetical protein GV64_10615 [Endozoicomonas elysicola]
MATNGESARKWLEENREQITEERILQIRSNLVKKVNQMAESDNLDVSDEHQGLLEALDVMDGWLQERTVPQEIPIESSELDYSPLIQPPSEPAPQLTQEEKLRRFQNLLKSSKK